MERSEILTPGRPLVQKWLEEGWTVLWTNGTVLHVMPFGHGEAAWTIAVREANVIAHLLAKEEAS